MSQPTNPYGNGEQPQYAQPNPYTQETGYQQQPQSPYTQSQYAQQPYAQQPYAQQPYAQQPYAQPYGQPEYYAPSNRWNGMAIAGFVCSFIFSIVGLVLSIIGYNQTRKTGEKGKELALAGIIISGVSIALAVIGVIVLCVVGFGIIGAALDYDDYDLQYDNPRHDTGQYDEYFDTASLMERETPEALLAGLTVRA